jgi:hypothetical protein
MFFRSVIAALLFSTSVVPFDARGQDCTVDAELKQQDGLKLEVAYRCKSATAISFTADGERMARRVLSFTAGKEEHPTPSNNAWRVDSQNGTVQARYRFDLTGYARSVDQTSSALQRGDGVLVLLSGWLLEPRGTGASPAIDIRVTTPSGLVFSSGLPKVGDVWRLVAGTNVRFAGYTVFGKLHHEEIAAPGNSTVRLAILDGLGESDRAMVVEWVRRTAEIESNYWQGFPAKQSLLALVPTAGRDGVGYGRSVPGGGPTVMVEIGAKPSAKKLYNDWVLVHEWIHIGMPFVRGNATWFMEGAATYVEPIVRARAGWKSETEVWDEWIANMPKGAPVFSIGLAKAGGPMNYWGGALFMLLADVEFRRATDGAKGLEDCLVGVLRGGLDGSKRATLEEFGAACDKATGTDVMSRLIDKHQAKGEKIDLAKLWSDLGVEKDGKTNDEAPLAKWRKMIVYGNKPVAKVAKPD